MLRVVLKVGSKCIFTVVFTVVSARSYNVVVLTTFKTDTKKDVHNYFLEAPPDDSVAMFCGYFP